MDTLVYIAQKYGIDVQQKHLPVEIPTIGRDHLAELFCELGFRMGAEIGVDQAKYTEVLCKCNPNAIIYGIDPWAAYHGYRDHLNQHDMDDLFSISQDRMSHYANCVLVREFSRDAVLRFADNALDFVYIDANHEFEFVVNDIIWWSKRVRRGGIVAGHDYRRVKNDYPMHVVYAVQAYTAAYGIRPWFTLGYNIGGKDRSRTWLWVKP